MLAVAAVLLVLCMIWLLHRRTGEIHGIYLSNERYEPVSGDAVLLKSAGHALLMDTGGMSSARSLIRYLEDAGVRKLDIMISHIHADHMGALLSLAECRSFRINHLYVPSRKYARASFRYEKAYAAFALAAEKSGAQIVCLTPGKRWKVGHMKIHILGPVGSYQPGDYYENVYTNNYSVSAMVSCGRVRYLTMGDAQKDEELELVARYGSRLKADIMKQSHHGCSTSSCQQLVDTVQPRYSFAMSDAYYPRTWKRLSSYGEQYITGEHRRTIVYKIKNGRIKTKKQ